MNWPAERTAAGGERGFTLIELLVVLTLVGLALGATFLRIDPHEGRAAARRAGHTLARQLDLARVLASSQGLWIEWTAGPDGGRFACTRAQDGPAPGGTRPDPEDPDPEDLGLRPLALPPGFRLQVQGGSGPGSRLSFHPDGSHDRARVTIEGDEGPVLALWLAGFGPVRVEGPGASSEPRPAAAAAGP